MKKNHILMLIMSAFLLSSIQGCGGEDNSKKVKEKFPPPPEDKTDYGLTYTGSTQDAFLSATDVPRIDAFVKSFILAQSQEANIRSLASDVLGNENSYIPEGDCGGNAFLTMGKVELGPLFENSLKFENYCRVFSGYTFDMTENGKVTAEELSQVNSNYLMRFYKYNYKISADAPYNIQMGGTVNVARDASEVKTFTHNIVISQTELNTRKTLTSKYETWIVKRATGTGAIVGETGTYYGGDLYHPIYGKVVVATVSVVGATGSVAKLEKISSGTVQFTGRNGGTPVCATVTFDGINSYKIKRVDVTDDSSNIDLTCPPLY